MFEGSTFRINLVLVKYVHNPKITKNSYNDTFTHNIFGNRMLPWLLTCNRWSLSFLNSCSLCTFSVSLC